MIKVESPSECKMFLRVKKEDGFHLKELMLTQVFNYKISENKRPIYGFNQKDFSQVVRGKRLFEGVIVIKKSLISDIGKLVDLASSKLKDDLNYSMNKIEYLKNMLNDNKEMQSQLNEYYERAIEEYQIKKDMEYSTNQIEVLNDMPEEASLMLVFGDSIHNDEWQKEYQDRANHYEDANIATSELENLIQQQTGFEVEEVHFLEKTGEVNIGKNDIDEVYKFFGKLKVWR